MVRASGLSDTTILRICHAFGLQRHRTETFKLSNDPQLVGKVHDIGVCFRTLPNGACAVVDEEIQVQTWTASPSSACGRAARSGGIGGTHGTEPPRRLRPSMRQHR